jgi:arsenate reductase (thioredoxin)
MTRILVLCTGNSCRSQMAAGFLRSFDPHLDVHSAGIQPALNVSRGAVTVMKEAGIDIGHCVPVSVDRYVGQSFDYVITVCDNAKESCPVFTREVGHRLHIGFDDPAEATGTPEQILAEFRRVRDEILVRFREFYATTVQRAHG